VKLLRDHRLAALLVAETVSSTGTQMTWVALPWFVLRNTSSPQRMTWVIIAEVLPVAILGFWGGAIAGRVGTRRTMLTCDLARVPLFAAIPALHAAGVLPFPALLALVAASGIFLAPYMGVQRAVLPELVGEEQADVAHLIAFFQAANRLTIFLGPPAAGLLIALVGSANILYIDAATYVASFLLVLAFVDPPEIRVPAEESGVLAGVRFLMRDRLLRVWTPAFTLLDTGWQLLFASLPVLVVGHYGANPHILGWLFGGLGGGALVGAFVAMRVVRRFEALTLGSAAFVCQICSLWVLAIPAPWFVAVAGMVAGGFFMSLVNSPTQALVMLRIPRHLRTQALGAFGVFQCTASPVGLVLAGQALAHYDSRSVLVVVLSMQTIAIAVFVAAAFFERSSLRAALVDSAA
jgi:MFS family permease